MKKKLLILCSSIVTATSLVSAVSCGPISEVKDRILFSWKKYLDEIPETIESIKVFNKMKNDISKSKRSAGQKLSKTQLGIDFYDKFPSWATPEITLSENWDPVNENDYIYLNVKLTTPDRVDSSIKKVKVTFSPIFDYLADLNKIQDTFTSIRSAKRIFESILNSTSNSTNDYLNAGDLVDAEDIEYVLPSDITKGINIFFKVESTWNNPETATQKVDLVLKAWLEKEGQINKSSEKSITVQTSSFEWTDLLDRLEDYYVSDLHPLEMREKIPREQRKSGSILSFEKIGVKNPYEGDNNGVNPEIRLKKDWNSSSPLELGVVLKKSSVADSAEKTIIVTPFSQIVPFNFSDDVLKYKGNTPGQTKTLILKNTQRYLQNSLKLADLKANAILTSEQIGMYAPKQTKGLQSRIKLENNWQLSNNNVVDAKVKLTLSGEYPEGVDPVSFGTQDILVKFKAQENVYDNFYDLIAQNNSNATKNGNGIIEINSKYDLDTLQSNIMDRYLNADVSLEKLGIENFPSLNNFANVSPVILGGSNVTISKCKYKLKIGKDWDRNSNITVNIIFSTVSASDRSIKIGNSWPYKLIVIPK